MAESTHKEISPLTASDVAGKRVSGLANRPTNSSGYGSHGLNASELKARMDAYSDAIREKLNDLIEVFNGADIPLPSFQWGGEDIANLQKLAELLKKPEFTDNLVIHNDADTDEVNLKEYIKQYKQTNEDAADLAIAAKNSAEGYATNASSSATDAANAASSASEQAAAALDSANDAAEILDRASEQFAAKLDKKPDGDNDLIENGKVSMRYIPDSLIGQVAFQGTWNATNGTPKKPYPSATKEGFYWICSAPGTKLPNGVNSSIYFETGDWAIIIEHDDEEGDTWDKVDNTDAVSSVCGWTGNVTLSATDIHYGANSNVSTEIGGLKSGKLDKTGLALWSLLYGDDGIDVTYDSDDKVVKIHPNLDYSAEGDVWTIGYNGKPKWSHQRVIMHETPPSYEQVENDIANGLLPSFVYSFGGGSKRYFRLSYRTGTGVYIFVCSYGTIIGSTGRFTPAMETAELRLGNNWTFSTQVLMEDNINKTQTINANSTSMQFPSAAATYAALNDIRKVAEGKCASHTVDETLTIDSIKTVLSGSPIAKAYYNGTDITESVLEGSYDYLVHNTDFVSSSDDLHLDVDYYIVEATPDSDSYVFYKIDDMKTGDVLYVIGTGYPDRWVSEPPSGGASKTLYTLETVRKEAVGRTVTIQPSQWSNNTATVTVMGVTATNIVICDASDPDVQATAQNTNTLTFTCTKTPTVSVTVKVVIL